MPHDPFGPGTIPWDTLETIQRTIHEKAEEANVTVEQFVDYVCNGKEYLMQTPDDG